MKTFKQHLSESNDKISDVVGAKKSILSKSNKNKTFTVRLWTQEDIEKWGERQTVKQGKYTWDITDDTPDNKTSFSIDSFRTYYDDFKTPSINVQKALEDIGKGKWEPSK
jgi:hypothetical protein